MKAVPVELTSKSVVIGGIQEGAIRKKRPTNDKGQEIGSTNYETVSFIDEASGRAETLDLDALVPVEGRPKMGTRSLLNIVSYSRQVKKARQDGSLYESRAYDMRCVGFQAAA